MIIDIFRIKKYNTDHLLKILNYPLITSFIDIIRNDVKDANKSYIPDYIIYVIPNFKCYQKNIKPVL